MSNTVTMPSEILDRMERAVVKVRERLLRATAALNRAGLPYAVVGGHAVASWVATIDEGAVRNCPDLDLLVRRSDLPAVAAALEKAGFVAADPSGMANFLDGPSGKPREAVHLLFAGEEVNDGDPLSAPEIVTTNDPAGFRVLILASLVELELLLNRNVNRMLIRDMIDVGLIDQSWLTMVPTMLAERLQAILDTPDG